MTNLNKVLDKLAQNSTIKEYLSEANDKYSQKPFALEHKGTYESVKSFGFIPCLISVLSASLVAVSLFPNMNLYMSLSLGLIAALAFEIAKSFVTRLGFRHFFKKQKGILVLIAAIAMTICSIALSSFGTYNAYLLTESNAKGNVSIEHENKADSLNGYYSLSIIEAKEQAKEYFKQVSWKGKISHKNAKTYNLLLDKVAALEMEYKQAAKELNTSKTKQIMKASEGMKPYLFILIGFALINEAIIFVFARFKEYYLYKSNRQVDLINQSDSLSISLDNLGSLAHLLQLNQSLTLNPVMEELPSSIGFKVSGQTIDKDNKAEQPSSNNSNRSNSSRSTTRSTTVKGKGGLEPRKCIQCGNEYKPSVVWQKYCSKTCNHAANNFKLKA